jgi:hypothetical protein
MRLRSARPPASIAAEPPVATQNRFAPLRPAAPAALPTVENQCPLKALATDAAPPPLVPECQPADLRAARELASQARLRGHPLFSSSRLHRGGAVVRRLARGAAVLLDLDPSGHRDHRPSRNPRRKRRGRHPYSPSAGGHAVPAVLHALDPTVTETTRSPRHLAERSLRRWARGAGRPAGPSPSESGWGRRASQPEAAWHRPPDPLQLSARSLIHRLDRATARRRSCFRRARSRRKYAAGRPGSQTRSVPCPCACRSGPSHVYRAGPKGGQPVRRLQEPAGPHARVHAAQPPFRRHQSHRSAGSPVLPPDGQSSPRPRCDQRGAPVAHARATSGRRVRVPPIASQPQFVAARWAPL